MTASTDRRRLRSVEPMTTNLLPELLPHFPDAEQTNDTVVVPLPGTVGTLVVTLSDPRPVLLRPRSHLPHIVGFYPGESWPRHRELFPMLNTPKPVVILADRSALSLVHLLRYLADPPEGVDHGAWIAQRLQDDRDKADRS